jgi:hypothetical protein
MLHAIVSPKKIRLTLYSHDTVHRFTLAAVSYSGILVGKSSTRLRWDVIVVVILLDVDLLC